MHVWYVAECFMGERMHYVYASVKVAFLACFCTGNQERFSHINTELHINLYILYCWNSSEAYFHLLVLVAMGTGTAHLKKITF